MFKKKMFVLVRKDLSQSQQAVQAGHAIAEYLLSGYNDIMWNNGTLVYLGVKNKSQLEMWYERLCDRGLSVAMFHEPDIGNEPTALATATNELNFEIFRKLNLI